MCEAKSDENKLLLGGGGDSKYQSCLAWPETHFGFGIFEI